MISRSVRTHYQLLSVKPVLRTAWTLDHALQQHTFFSATTVSFSLSLALYTTPYVPSPSFSVFSYLMSKPRGKKLAWRVSYISRSFSVSSWRVSHTS